ncbi:MAG TPA: radical SAM protein [Candidatus Dormibacteraeota bacterium]|nr:radical SAM protein [Candidatus Dormibacteraeota bacterium]
MKIVLAYRCHDLGRMEFYSRFTPLGLGYINALLRSRGYDSRILNCSAWSWKRTERFLKEERPDVLGVSVFTFNRHEAMRLAALARKAVPSCFIVAGGPHATHLPHHLLLGYPQIDVVVRGEGEETMLDLVRARERGDPNPRLTGIPGITFRSPDKADGKPDVPTCALPTATPGKECLDTPDRPVIADLDRLPHPAVDPATIGVDPVTQFEFIITSRGCPAACTFCSSPDFWGRGLRFRSAASMVEEVRLLRERHGVVYVSVRDDTFTVHKKRVVDFCRMLIEQKIDLLWDCQSRVNAVDEERLVWMRRAGCTHIQYGVESGSPRMLERLNKGITLEQVRAAALATRRVGLGLSIYLITGIDSETDDDLAATLRLIEEIRPHDGLVSPMTVYPGTALYEEAKTRFGLGDDYWARERGEAYYVREDPWTRRSVRTLAAALRRTGRQAAYGPDDFDRQRAVVGDCYALRLSAGEYWQRRGAWGRAGAEYLAILRDNPRSLWARMRLGTLSLRRRKLAEASGHFRAAAEIAPAFHLAHSLLGGALLRMRRRDEAAASFVRAHLLDPGDPQTRSRVRRLAPGFLSIDRERAAASVS